MMLRDLPAVLLVALVMALAVAWFFGISPSQVEHTLGIA